MTARARLVIAAALSCGAVVCGCGSSNDGPAPVAPTDAGPDGAEPVDASPPPHPTPERLEFKPVAPLPAGEQILFNDWNGAPNALWSMTPDGSSATKVFTIGRVWAFGVSHGVDKIAFSAFDPDQEAHFGVAIGDAIQHTWLYDVATQSITPLSKGNVNDECHAFSADDKTLFVCRRYDFHFEDIDGERYVVNKGWRIAAIDVATSATTFLSPDLKGEYHLGPQQLPGGARLLYSITKVTPPPTKYSVVSTGLPAGGEATLVRADASRASLAPDGKRYAYANPLEKGALYVGELGATAATKIATAAGSDLTWSPDGTRLAYLRFDDDKNCSDIEVVKADGSQADAPTRLRECLPGAEFITQLAWVIRK
ncbi:MAG: PD40 domain-containing protein [Deltaproteobacteria bacterium]|nr:PD40 domain-containing protein [Deltaproteobacteria bacterium]